MAECEAVIARGLKTFVEVGSALLTIRDNRLYRQGYGTFEDYCQERWGFTDNYARRLISSAEVIGGLKTVPIGTVLPSSESQARPLTALAPEVQPFERVVQGFKYRLSADQVLIRKGKRRVSGQQSSMIAVLTTSPQTSSVTLG